MFWPVKVEVEAQGNSYDALLRNFQAGSVRLVVYDALGRPVRVLVDGVQAAGEHEAVFEAGTLPSGAYRYRLETAQGVLLGAGVWVVSARRPS